MLRPPKFITLMHASPILFAYLSNWYILNIHVKRYRYGEIKLITIQGTVEEIIFSNEINGYMVCDIKSGDDVVTAVGYMPFINAGETLRLTGRWVTHRDYGEQLKVDTYEKLPPQTLDALEKYLASGVIKGVGPATAAKIVEFFGEETIDIIQFKPERLSEIKGITADKAFRIGQAFQEQRDLREVVMFFQQYGISPVFSAKIYRTFGERTIDEIKSNPYRLADEIFGISFKTADRIAMSLGIDCASAYRISSGIKYVLMRAASNGHTFMPEMKLIEHTSALLDVNISSINDSLISLTLDKAVCVEREESENRVYLSPFYHAELGVCRKLVELSNMNFDGDLSDFDEKLERIQAQQGIVLADMQKVAIREAITNGVLVITGGPGTGKTTIIKSIIKLLDSEGYQVALAAPTGRAAKRMSEAAGFEAKTIHRLLEIGYTANENEQVFFRTEENPIEADVIIIDEMSMVDIILMNNLLKAVAPGTRLVLVGDVSQLPSVGPGNVLKDIINGSMMKTVRLTEIFRQAQESMIIVNAHRVNKGEVPHLNIKDKDFFFLHRGSAEAIVKTILELCSRRLPAAYGFDPMRHIQVLTPSKKGLAGVHNLNIELQSVLNPQHSLKPEKAYRDYVFREGDKVMQVKNNYNLRWEKISGHNVEGTGIFNGDTGIIQKIDDDQQKISVLFEDDKIVEYDYSILDELEPAFAITIHKSQGSEFPVVVMPIFPGPSVLMTRNLLYTAITRAKELVILVGVENTLNEMVSNDREALRYSCLDDKLRKSFQGVVWEGLG
jgi:exodeoxyribonuclease V alpha subunit